MEMKRLGHVAICVEDVAKAAQFYQNLGMKLVWQDNDWAYLKAGQDGLALMSPDYDQAGPHFGFVFSDRADIDRAYDRLQSEGVQVSKIHDHRDGTASFYGRDPFGNWFEYLYEPEAADEKPVQAAASTGEPTFDPDAPRIWGWLPRFRPRFPMKNRKNYPPI